MTLAPLTTGPHLVPANRLAFTTPVREAGGAGHWITLHSAEDPESGTCHVWVNGGSGPGSGTIGKGPKSLVGHHIAALASHPSVSKAQHHPVGHEPPGAREHPHYAEASPKAEPRTPNAGAEAPKRPGKPYARLHGAEQGTRQEQIGKALSAAQGAARSAKAGAPGPYSGAAAEHQAAEKAAHDEQHRADMAHIDAGGTWTGGGEPRGGTRATRDAVRARSSAWHEAYGRATGAEHEESKPVQQAHFDAGGTFTRSGDPRGGTPHTRQAIRQHRTAWGRDERTGAAAGKAFIAPGKPNEHTEDKVADAAVAHQQAQADLAAHRAKADRNPNPWAPHLSPPVGDAKDRELAEKATRAQMAHQAVVAQQQGQAQAEQQEGQRAHEKDMVRLKAEATQQAAPITPLKGRLAGLMSPEEHARLQAEHAARPQQALPEQPKATPPKEGNLLRDKASPSGKRRLELPQTAPQPEQVAGAPKLQGSAAQEVARMESALPQRTRPLASTEVNAAVQHARRDTVEHGRVLAARLAQTAGQTPNLEVLHHGKVKTETLAELNSHAGKLPQHYKDLMHAYGTHTFVGGGTASKGGVAPAIAKSQARAYGVFAPELREVHVHPSAVKTGRGVHTLHHELGHATDHALGALRAAQGEPFSRHGGAMLDRLHNPSQTPEAAALHAKHRDNDLLSPNMRQNPEEFFADAFAMHHTQPERLKEAAPDVADYMHRIDKETRERIARARGR